MSRQGRSLFARRRSEASLDTRIGDWDFGNARMAFGKVGGEWDTKVTVQAQSLRVPAYGVFAEGGNRGKTQ